MIVNHSSSPFYYLNKSVIINLRHIEINIIVPWNETFMPHSTYQSTRI